MATTRRHDTWRRAELNALDMLYRARWRWSAIAVHVSAIYGIERTRDACRIKAQRIALTGGKSRGRVVHDVGEDIEDMAILGYSTRRMATELGISQSTVMRKLGKLSPQRRHAWRATTAERVSRGAERGWRNRNALNRIRQEALGR